MPRARALSVCSVLLLLPISAAPDAAPPPTTIVIPLQISGSGGRWGPDRDADHATVAVNERGDVAVAYHSTRTGFPGANYPLRQVELAILRPQPGGGWSVTQQELLGGVLRSPLHPPLAQTIVRCERPDVVAVGERFFVTWTRRYERSFPGQWREPATLECAWLAWSGTRYEVLTGGAPEGQGYVLDAAFDVRECAGVADAVALDAGSATTPARAAVIYAHQTDFGDDPASQPAFDGMRRADLRLAMAALSPAGAVTGGAQAEPLVRNVPYDGEPDPHGGSFPALYLPDCAPASVPTRFWMGYQEQRLSASGSVPDGRVRLTMCEWIGGAWTVVAAQTFGDAQHPAWRHRIALDSRPETAGGLDRASCAYVRLDDPDDADVEYAEWGYDAQGGLFLVPWPPGAGFPNDGLYDAEPVPLHGGDHPLLRRCYHGHDASVDSIRYYDVARDRVSTVAKTPRRISRPAVAIGPSVGGGEVIATTWEAIPAGKQTLRIHVMLE